MFLFILESIGTSELILIGIIALIFLGPRKLPQIAKTIGKTMAEFRNTTNEFKETWQKEVDFEEEAEALRTGDFRDQPQPVPRIQAIDNGDVNTIAPPEIRAAQPDMFENLPTPEKEIPPAVKTVETATTDTHEVAPDLSDKKNWL